MKFQAYLSLVYFLDVGHRLTIDLSSLPDEKSEKFQIRSGFPEFEFALAELIRQNDAALISKAISDSYSHEKAHPAGNVEIGQDRLHSFMAFRVY